MTFSGETPRNPLTQQLVQTAKNLGLTPDQAATMLRNEGAEQRLVDQANLQTMAEQGQMERHLDLRLIPYGTMATLCVRTFTYGDPNAPLNTTSRQELSFMRSLHGFTHRRTTTQPAGKEQSLRSGKKLVYQKPTTTELNAPVALAGAIPVNRWEHGNAHDSDCRMTPTIAHLGTFIVCVLKNPNEELRDNKTVSDTFCSQKKTYDEYRVGASVEAATLQYQDPEQRTQELVVFGEPYRMLGK